MTNPWLQKPPLLSTMLSEANAWAGATHNTMTSQAKRKGAAATREGIRQASDFWITALTGTVPKKRKGKT